MGLQNKVKQDIWKQDIQGILEEHLKTELWKGLNCLLIKEKGLNKMKASRTQRHSHSTGYLHAQRPLGVRQHEKCTGVIEIWLFIY